MFGWHVLKFVIIFQGTDHDPSLPHSLYSRYIVITGVIFLSDTGVMAFIFLPKIKYAKEGLPEGMSVVESMNLPSTVSQQQRNKSFVSRASTGSDYGAERRASTDSSLQNNPKVIRSEASDEGSLDESQVPEMEERQLSQSSASQRRVTFDMSESSGEGGILEAAKAEKEEITCPADEAEDVHV